MLSRDTHLSGVPICAVRRGSTPEELNHTAGVRGRYGDFQIRTPRVVAAVTVNQPVQ